MLSVDFWKASDGMTSCSNLWHHPHQSAKRSTKMSWFLAFAFCCACANDLIHGDADAVDETASASAATMASFFTGGPPVTPNDCCKKAIPIRRPRPGTNSWQIGREPV